MTVEERLARLEERHDNSDRRLSSIERKVDELLQAAHMGKGAWFLLLRIGVVLSAIGGVLAWIVNNWPKR
jgi:hypothetical protein